MEYKIQLTQEAWFSKREEILKRDGFACTICGKKRSEFRRMAKFKDIAGEPEIVDYNALKTLGLPLNTLNTDYNDKLIFSKKWVSVAKYIGDTSRPFVFEDLRFCQKYLSRKSTNKKEYPSIFFFYADAYDCENRVDLNVHHKYYVKGCMAWEYDNDSLTLLCSECHKNLHHEQVINVYSSKPEAQGREVELDHYAEICGRCSGAGIFPQYYYIDEGVCWECHGEGVVKI